MEIILYLSAAVAAIAFLVLVIFLSRTLKSLQLTLDSVAQTLDGLEKQMQGVTVETASLLHKTNVLAEDLQMKSENLNSVVHAVKNVGTSIQDFNSSIQKVSNKVQAGIDNNQEKISQIVQWSNVALEIRDKWKARTNEKMPAVQTTSLTQTEGDATDNLPKKRFLRSR
jgi:uncharacterized protein YoxC